MRRRSLILATALLALFTLWALPTQEAPVSRPSVSPAPTVTTEPAPTAEEDWEPSIAPPIVPVLPEEMPDPLHPAPGSAALIDEHNPPPPADLARDPELVVDPDRGRAPALPTD